MVFGLFVLNRVYNYYVSVLNRVCILSFILNRDLKWRVLSYTALHRVSILALFFFVLNRVKDFKPVVATLYPNIGQAPPHAWV